MNFVKGGVDYGWILEDTGIYSRHFTFIFNTFVMMQVFNFINCRKLHEEINVFKGITESYIFLIIVATILILQILLVTFTGIAFGVYPNFGLTIHQWLLSILIGSFSLLVNLLLKLLPITNNEH